MLLLKVGAFCMKCRQRGMRCSTPGMIRRWASVVNAGNAAGEESLAGPSGGMAEAGAAPYEVPPAWNVVLDAWNDPSLGVGLVAVTAGNADGEGGRNGQSGVGAGSGHGGRDRG